MKDIFLALLLSTTMITTTQAQPRYYSSRGPAVVNNHYYGSGGYYHGGGCGVACVGGAIIGGAIIGGALAPRVYVTPPTVVYAPGYVVPANICNVVVPPNIAPPYEGAQWVCNPVNGWFWQ